MRNAALPFVSLICAAGLALGAVESLAVEPEKSVATPPAQSVGPLQVATNYSKIVLAAYGDAALTAQKLHNVLSAFAENPSEAELALARETWLAARAAYTQTEAFRFYDGPIDVYPRDISIEGPERNIDSWPIDPTFLDATKAKPEGGLVFSKKTINSVKLRELNQYENERQVTLGFHVLEFLLWGERPDKSLPGKRDVKDFMGEDLIVKRRRALMTTVSEMLSQNLQYLAAEWSVGQDKQGRAYVGQFLARPKEAIGKILTGIAILSNYELAEVHMGKALASKDANYEQDQFSGTTVKDWVGMAQGMRSVITGEYGAVKGPGIADLLAQTDPELASKLRAQTNKVLSAIKAIPEPFGSEVLGTRQGSSGRDKTREAMAALNEQGTLIVQAAKKLGVTADIYGY